MRPADPRPRLRHVGAGDFTNLEALIGGRQLFLQNPNILLAQAHNLPVADDIHVGLDGLEKNILLDGQQALLAGLDIGFRRLGSVDRFEAPEDRLRQADGHGLRIIFR